MGRVLGVDVGRVRTGVALSDPSATIASPLLVLELRSRKRLALALHRLVRDHEVEAVVVGVPLSLDGGRGPAAEEVLAFIERLRQRCPVPVYPWDERFSTVGAQAALHAGGLDTRASRGKVDKVAAAIILQSWLDARCRDEVP